MKFMINSKYDKDDAVILKNKTIGQVIKVEIKLFDNYYYIKYLIEFDNKERKWVDERDLYVA